MVTKLITFDWSNYLNKIEPTIKNCNYEDAAIYDMLTCGSIHTHIACVANSACVCVCDKRCIMK